MKRASIKTAILVPSLAVLAAGIIALVAVAGVLSTNTTNDLTDRLMDARVNQYSNEFLMFGQEVYGALNTVVPIVSNYIDQEFALDVSDPRGEVIKILSDVLLANDKIYSIWTCWEPNAFDGKDGEFARTSFYDATGRFVPYIYKDGDSLTLEALVDYDDQIAGEYYQGARNTGEPYVTDPYDYDVNGTVTSFYTFAVPIIKDGKVAGVVGVDINLQDIITLMNAGSILDDGYLLTLSPGGFVASHRNEDLLMTHYTTVWMRDYQPQVEEVIANGGSFSVNAYSDITNSNVLFLGSGVMLGDTGRYWVVCGVVPEKTVNAASTSLLWTIIGIGLALILVVGITIDLIVRGRLKGLPALTANAEAIAVGDIDSANFDNGTEKTKNEIALLRRAFSSMTAGIRQQADILSQVSQGDYSVTVPIRSDKDAMNQAINHMIDSTNDTLNQINASAVQVSAGSKQIADGAQSLAQGSTEQASSIEELSASISEIADKTKRNADIAKEAAELSGSIRSNAEKGSTQMAQMMQAVTAISDASNQIEKVIKVIDDIAFQTNILALNAAVEAARAGQHGKGFAVVAEEVRNLAAKSAEAAKDTGGLIENSIDKANLGLNIATETSTSLKEIVNGINRSAEIMAQIARSSDEQAGAIAQINTGIDQVAQVVQQNSATSEESAAASEEMSGQSDMLEQLIAQFKLKDSEPSPSFSAPSRQKARALPQENGFSFAGNSGEYGKY